MSNRDLYQEFRDFTEERYPWFDCGAAIGAGWHHVILRWLIAVQRLLDEHPGASIEMVQVKEKLGSLRIYSRPSGDILADVSAQTFLAECRAARTCEVCGQPGHPVNDGGALLVRCREHQGKARVQAYNIDLAHPESAYRYDPLVDDLVLLSTQTLAQTLEVAAGSEILSATVGPFRGLDLDGYLGWRDPVPREKRGVVLPWAEARSLLDYEIKPTFSNASLAHPVTCWTATHVISTRDRWGVLDVVKLPLEPAGYGSAAMPMKGFV